MKTPKTALDTAFSERGAAATDWEQTRHVLENAELFWISTVRADGRPHVTPPVAVWLDDSIYFATGPQEQKAVNLKTNRNVKFPRFSGHPSAWSASRSVTKEERYGTEVSGALSAGVPA